MYNFVRDFTRAYKRWWGTYVWEGWGLFICDIMGGGGAYNWTKKSVSQQGTVYIRVMIKILFEFDCFFILQDDVVCKKSDSFLSGGLITGFTY